MDLQAKLTSLLKEKEEQEYKMAEARNEIIRISKLIRAAERLIKDANEVFGETLVLSKDETSELDKAKEEAFAGIEPGLLDKPITFKQ